MVHLIKICTQHHGLGVQDDMQICLLMSSRLPPLCHLKLGWDARKKKRKEKEKSDIKKAHSHNAEGKNILFFI